MFFFFPVLYFLFWVLVYSLMFYSCIGFSEMDYFYWLGLLLVMFWVVLKSEYLVFLFGFHLICLSGYSLYPFALFLPCFPPFLNFCSTWIGLTLSCWPLLSCMYLRPYLLIYKYVRVFPPLHLQKYQFTPDQLSIYTNPHNHVVKNCSEYAKPA